METKVEFPEFIILRLNEFEIPVCLNDCYNKELPVLRVKHFYLIRQCEVSNIIFFQLFSSFFKSQEIDGAKFPIYFGQTTRWELLALTKGGFNVVASENNPQGAQPRGIHIMFGGGKPTKESIQEFKKYQNSNLDWISPANYVKSVKQCWSPLPWG